MKLRPYQIEAVHEVESVLAFDSKAIVTIATGGGKSLVIAALCADYSDNGMTVVVLTNIGALIPQLSNTLTSMNVDHNIIKAGAHRATHGAKVWLVMEQSFHGNKRMEMKIKCDILIKDEYHIGVGQKRFEDISRDLEPLSTVGFTATPMDEKGYLMHGVENSQMVQTGDMKRLTEEGYLTPLRFFVPKWSEKVDYSSAASGNDYTTDDLESIILNDIHTDLVIKSMEEMNAKSKKTLVYATSIDHANSLHEALCKSNYSAEVVHSGMPPEANALSIGHFKDDYQSRGNGLFGSDGQKEVNCLISVNSLLIGFDAPNVQLLVNTRPTKVRRLWIQLTGRGTRTFPGKDYCEVLDLGQCVKEHGFPDEYYPLVKRGDKKASIRAKEDAECTVVGEVAREEPTLITRELVVEKIEELLKKSKNIPDMKMNELIGFFDATNDYKTIIHIAYEISMRTKGNAYTVGSVEWTAETWGEMIDEFPDYKGRVLRTLRSSAKKKVHEDKKLTALHYMPKWIKEETNILSGIS